MKLLSVVEDQPDHILLAAKTAQSVGTPGHSVILQGLCPTHESLNPTPCSSMSFFGDVTGIFCALRCCWRNSMYGSP